jgi:hypothetical protein
MEKEFNNKNINIVFSVVLPGDGKSWPDAGIVIGNQRSILEKFTASDRKNLDDLSMRFSEMPPADRVFAMKAFETETPALFARLVAAVTDAYYTTPEVVAQVEALANAAPREPSAQFDEALVSSVVRTQAGKYRA